MTAKLPQLLAIGLIRDAHSYVECARLLNDHQPGAAKYSQPTYFLLCQAMELVLKAHLAASGVRRKRFAGRLAIRSMWPSAMRDDTSGLLPPMIGSQNSCYG
jgi:hypothetical protein